MRAASIKDLLEAYRLAAQAHRQASLTGDYKIRNTQADRIAQIGRDSAAAVEANKNGCATIARWPIKSLGDRLPRRIG